MATATKEEEMENINNSPAKDQDGKSESDDEDVYEVEQIIGVNYSKGKAIYKVRWAGYSPSWDTWEPAENLQSCQEMINVYLESKQKNLQETNQLPSTSAKCKQTKTSESEQQKSDDEDKQSVSTTSSSGGSQRKKRPSYYYASSSDEDFDTLKDKFWRNLDEGKVNIFGSDMYSKIKEQGRVTRGNSQDTVSLTSNASCSSTGSFGNLNTLTEMEKSPKKQSKSRVTSSKNAGSRKSRSSISSSSSKGGGRRKSKSKSAETLTSQPKDTTSKISSSSATKGKGKLQRKRSASASKNKTSHRKKSIDTGQAEPMHAEVPAATSGAQFVQQETEDLDFTTDRDMTHSYTDDYVASLNDFPADPQHSPESPEPVLSTWHANQDNDEDKDTSDLELPTSFEKPLPGLSTPIGDIPSPVEDMPDLLLPGTLDLDELPEVSLNTSDLLDTIPTEVEQEPHAAVSSSHVPSKDGTAGDIKTSDQSRSVHDVKTEYPVVSSTSSKLLQKVTHTTNTNSSLASDNSSSIVTSAMQPTTTHTVQPTASSSGENNNAMGSKHPGVATVSSVTDTAVDTKGSITSTNSDANKSPTATKAYPPGMRRIPSTQPKPKPMTTRPTVALWGSDGNFDLDLPYRKDNVDWTPDNEPLDLSNLELCKAVLDNDFDTVRKAFLCNKVYDVEQPDQNGSTLLMAAARFGYDDVLELLVAEGANLNSRQKDGRTALMLACEHGLRCTVELLLMMGARVNPQLQGNRGDSALIMAAKGGHHNIVNLLLEYGANFAALSATENTALNYAKKYNRIPVMDVITKHMKRVTSKFEEQMLLTLNETAQVESALFPVHVFALSESDKFQITFHHDIQPTKPGVGMLLFIAHANFNRDDIRCRFYGNCSVQSVTLNSIPQYSLTEGKFVMSFTPLNPGRNHIEINTVRSPKSKVKLIVCAYKTHLLLSSDTVV